MKLRKGRIFMTVNVKGGKLSKKEIEAYTTQLREANPDKYIKNVELTVDGDYVDVKYDYDSVPFERIRRITGYLVGTVDRFNNAKRAEVEDRVKHSVPCTECCSVDESHNFLFDYPILQYTCYFLLTFVDITVYN